jgi:hypothetical protein
MTQPLKSDAAVGTMDAELEERVVSRYGLPTFAFRVGFVAASIPMTNRKPPHPANRRGIPVARSSRARV